MADTCLKLTEKVCRNIRVTVGAAMDWPKSGRRLYCLSRRRVFETEGTRNALLWSKGIYRESMGVVRLLGACDRAVLTSAAHEGMCGLELELYRNRTPELVDTCFVLLSRDGDVLESCIDNWPALRAFAADHVPAEREKRRARERWADAILRWRKRATMPRAKVPLGILADYAQDRDDGQDDAILIRAAIAAGFKG